MSFWGKLKDVFGIEYIDEEENKVEIEAVLEPAKPSHNPITNYVDAKDRIPSNITRNTITKSEQILPESYTIFEPLSYDDCKTMADHLKESKYIIVKYTSVTTTLARQIFFFMDGCVYALDGTRTKISNNIFLYTPKDTEIKKDFSVGTKLKTPWR